MSNVTEIKRGIEHAKKQLEASEKVVKLMADPLFQEVVLDGYLNQGMDQLLEDRANPHKQSPDAIALNNRRIDGIAGFKGWFNDQLVAGSQAESALSALRIELDTALTEDAEGGDYAE